MAFRRKTSLSWTTTICVAELQDLTHKVLKLILLLPRNILYLTLSTKAASLEHRKTNGTLQVMTGVQKSIQIPYFHVHWQSWRVSSNLGEGRVKVWGYLLAQPCLKVSATENFLFSSITECFSSLATWNQAAPAQRPRRRDVTRNAESVVLRTRTALQPNEFKS